MLDTLVLFAQRTGSSGGEEAAGIMGMVCGCVCWLLIFVGVIFSIVGMWKVFAKAGEPGWAAIVPIYNIIVLHKISGKDTLALVLALIPPTSVVGVILIGLGVAERFGKSTGFGIGLGLLPIIFYPILGFGSAQYQGDGGSKYGRRRSRRDDDDDEDA